MTLLRRLRYWLDIRRERVNLDEEMTLHVALRAERLEAGGMSPAQAARTARRRFGNRLRLRERGEDIWLGRQYEEVVRDLRIGARGLVRHPGFTAVALLTLGLGIGANTAIFSVVKAVLVDPLAYAEPDRIVAIQTLWTNTGHTGAVSGGDYTDLVAAPSPFAATTRYVGGELAVETRDQAEFAWTYGVDAGFARVFQLTPIAGRLIARDEFASKAPLAMVSGGFAARHFGDAAGALGQVLHIEGIVVSIVGVLPAAFHFPAGADVWFPMPYENPNRTSGNYRALALLKPGVTIDDARVHLAGIGARLQAAFPSTHTHKSFTALPLKDLFVQDSRMTLWVLMGSVALLLLVACANVTNLQLARAMARTHEIAMRAALGASRWRLVRQSITESALLALIGGVLGLLVAWAGVAALVRIAPASLPRLDDIHLSTSVLAFNMAAALAAAALFGVWPALAASGLSSPEALVPSGSRAVVGARRAWRRDAVVAVEIGLAFMLAMGAGLLFRSFLALTAVDLGYDTAGRLALSASIPAETEAEYLQAGATFERIFSALRELPGVHAAAGVMGLPDGPYHSDGLYAVEGMQDFVTDQFDRLPHAGFRLTSPGYFSAMGVSVLEGRDFTTRDLYDAEPVAIVSETLVRQVFHGQSPLGRRLKCGLDRDVWMRVVGVVGDMRNDNPASVAGPELYMPYRQHPYHANDLQIVIQADGDVSAAARRTIAAIDPRIPVKVTTVQRMHDDAIALPRFRTWLLIVFAAVATALAIAGVYGVMSYAVARRRGEMGLRLALGATRGQIVSLLVGRAAILATIGLAGGLAASALTGRSLDALLYGIQRWDPVAIGGAVVVMGSAALVAAFIPALRAARVDPVAALRQE